MKAVRAVFLTLSDASGLKTVFFLVGKPVHIPDVGGFVAVAAAYRHFEGNPFADGGRRVCPVEGGQWREDFFLGIFFKYRAEFPSFVPVCDCSVMSHVSTNLNKFRYFKLMG